MNRYLTNPNGSAVNDRTTAMERWIHLDTTGESATADVATVLSSVVG